MTEKGLVFGEPVEIGSLAELGLIELFRSLGFNLTIASAAGQTCFHVTDEIEAPRDALSFLKASQAAAA